MKTPFAIVTLAALVAVLPQASLSTFDQSPTPKPAEKDNVELAQMYKDDQDDRKPDKIDWAVVGPRDRQRLARTKELVKANRLVTGTDFYHSAMILQHADAPEDYLLAHELCIVAAVKGEKQAKWLAAASEDRFLMTIGRPQRFGTQFRADKPDGMFRLYKIEPGMTDELRREFDVPPLKDAEARAGKMNEKKKPAQP